MTGPPATLTTKPFSFT